MPANGNGARKTRFGDFVFDPAANELVKHGIRLKVQEQPLAVLRTLLEKPGEIVSREELQKRLWPDGTFVDFEQSLNKAVNKLREALCDSADKPRYVETVSRRGYRFVGAVEVDGPPPAVPIPGKSNRRWWPWAAACVVGVALITGLWPLPNPEVQIVPLTSDSSEKLVPWFGAQSFPYVLATDGNRIIYSRTSFASRLWSVPKGGGESTPMELPFLLKDQIVTISDFNLRHQQMLIVTFGSTGARIWLVGADGSKPKRRDLAFPVGPVSISPDLKTLLIPRKQGLFTRPIDGGEEKRIVLGDWRADPSALWHPSGEGVALVREAEGGFRLWEARADGSQLKPLFPDFSGPQKDPSWSVDGKRLYFISEGQIYLLTGRRWLGWLRKPRPVRLTAGTTTYYRPLEDPANPQILYTLGVAKHGSLMKLNRKTNVFEPYLDGLSADCLDYSPDGQYIVYVSYPKQELWKCRRDGSGRALLVEDLLVYMPKWSPDGKRIAFSAKRRGIVDGYRPYIIPADGGRPEQPKGYTGTGTDVNWSPDGTKLLFSQITYYYMSRKDELGLILLDLNTGQLREIATPAPAYSPRWSPDGKLLFALRGSHNRGFLYHFATSTWTDFFPRELGFQKWSPDSRYIYGRDFPTATMVRVDAATRKREEIRKVSEFKFGGNEGPYSGWTPDFEPIVLNDLQTQQIYRIERER